MDFPQSEGGFTLKSLCLQTIANEVTATAPSSSVLHKSNFWLPIGVSQEIFDLGMNGAVVADEVNNVVKHFLKDPLRTPLDKICFQNLRGVHVDLTYQLVKANRSTLTLLDVRGCHTLPKKFWVMVNDAPKLQTLETTKLEVELWCPNLTTLVVDWVPKTVVQKFRHRIRPKYYNKLLENVLPNLKHLDLSWCPWVNRLTSLSKAKNLETLVLRNCNVRSLVWEISIRSYVLDISIGKEFADYHIGTFPKPHEVYDLLVNSLEKLESINISGTNLDDLKEFSSEEEEPFCTIIGSNGLVVPTEVIKINYNMPRTMYHHLRRLDAILNNDNLIDPNMLLEVQMRLLKNFRHNEEYRYWVLESTLKLLEYLDRPDVSISMWHRMKLWPLVNRLLFSYEDKEVPEQVLTLLFQIYFRLFPVGETVKDDRARKEILRLGMYLLTLRTSSYVFLKTETLHCRLFHRISIEPSVCENISAYNAAVKSCISFFASLQLYVGHSVSVNQTPHIVYDVWKTILNLMNASPVGTRQFLKHRGLYWISAHLSYFKKDHRTRKELCRVFLDILKRLDQDDIVEEKRGFDISEAAKEVMNEIKSQVEEE